MAPDRPKPWLSIKILGAHLSDTKRHALVELKRLTS